MNIAVSILGLAVLIFVHELGHFVTSLAVGMKPRRFYVGFPPAVWKTTRGGVEYAVGAIPLGGFVKIPGMHRPLVSDVDEGIGRVSIGFAGEIAQVRAGLEADDHPATVEALVRLRERLDRTHVSERTRAALERGIDDLRDALGPSAYWRAPTWKRVLVIAAGPLANVVLAFVLLTGLFATTDSTATTRLERVEAGSPAEQAGAQPGDRIVSINGHAVDPAGIGTQIRAAEGRPLVLVVEREGRTVSLDPVVARREGDGWRIGVMLAGAPLSPGRSAATAAELTGIVSLEIVRSIGQLRTSEGRENVSSPIGIVEGSSQAAQAGVANFVGLLALLSLSIALLNLLPLLPLDGGHIVFAVAEGLRRRAVSRAAYQRASMVGIGVVLILFVIGVGNDLERLSG